MTGTQSSPRILDVRRDPAGLRSALRRYFLKRTGATEADDLVQEVLIRLQARGSHDDIGNMTSYVFAIASNVLKEANRCSHRYILGGDTEAEDADWLTPERILAGRMDVARLMAAIEKLPDRTRRIFVAHRFEEMTYGAIGRLFGISVSAVEKHIMAALAMLAAAVRNGER